MKTPIPKAFTGDWQSYVRFDSANPGFLLIDCDVGLIRPPPFTPSEDIKLHAALIAAAPALFRALSQLVEDSECYCCDTVAAKGPCGYCVAKGTLAKAATPISRS